jgi:DNA-binding LytR/AlgR family response regulator
MKIRIETDNSIMEPEIIIRCGEIDSEVVKAQRALLEAISAESRLQLEKDGKEFYLFPEEILFFEASAGKTWAHTTDEVFEAKLRLYELEAILPHSFIRISKSAIVGCSEIYSVEKNITGPSVVRFRGSHKQISASRQYFRILQDRLNG